MCFVYRWDPDVSVVPLVYEHAVRVSAAVAVGGIYRRHPLLVVVASMGFYLVRPGDVTAPFVMMLGMSPVAEVNVIRRIWPAIIVR